MGCVQDNSLGRRTSVANVYNHKSVHIYEECMTKIVLLMGVKNQNSLETAVVGVLFCLRAVSQIISKQHCAVGGYSPFQGRFTGA